MAPESSRPPLLIGQRVQLALWRPEQEGQPRISPRTSQTTILCRLNQKRVPLHIELGRCDWITPLDGLAHGVEQALQLLTEVVPLGSVQTRDCLTYGKFFKRGSNKQAVSHFFAVNANNICAAFRPCFHKALLFKDPDGLANGRAA